MTPAGNSPLWKRLYAQVLAAIALGVLVEWLWPTTGAALRLLGDGFIKLVKMIITPVIFLTVVTGIAGMRGLRAAHRGQSVRSFHPDVDAGAGGRAGGRQRRPARRGVQRRPGATR